MPGRFASMVVPLSTLVLALGACSSGQSIQDAQPASGGSQAGGGTAQEEPEKEEQTRAPARVDPRKSGFEISLGEWAVTPETKVVRPGRITFVVTNRGTIDHGFEIEADGDHSGQGGAEGLKMETKVLRPGESVRMSADLAPGTYKIECLVDGHDDMGMEGFLEVSADAPLVSQEGAQDDEESGNANVSIESFSFSPTNLEVSPGTKVTWTNNDPTDHTVTSNDSSFSSETLAQGDTFSVRLREPGTYPYRCAVHPDMTARITVAEG
jgi:plastocyanin